MDNLTARLRRSLTSPRLLHFLIGVVCIALLSLIFFHPDAVEGNVLRQNDIVQGLANGQETAAAEAATGEKSYWTGSLFSGMPTYQISPSYPSSAMYQWVNKVMGLWLPSPANLLAMMMMGFFILLMAMGMRWWMSLLGAVAWGLSSYFIILIGAGHIWKFVTLAYIPPTIAGVVLAYRGRYIAGAGLAALFAMMQLAWNHVQMTYYFLPVIAVFVIAYAVKAQHRGRWGQWGVATASLVVAALLAVGANSPGLYHTWQYTKHSMRGAHSELTSQRDNVQATDGLDRDYITAYSYQPSETFSLLIPDIKGGASVKPEKGKISFLTLDMLPDAAAKTGLHPAEQQYLAQLTQYFGDEEGTNGPVYVGALIFALALLGAVICRGPMRWMLIVLTLLAAGLAWGRHMQWLTDLFIDYVPMYSSFRTVESILVVVQFTLPLLAVLALQHVFGREPEGAWKKYGRTTLMVGGGVAAFCLLVAFFPSITGSLISERDRMLDAMMADYLAQSGYSQTEIYTLSLKNPSIYNAVTELRGGMVSGDAWRSLLFVVLGFGVIVLWMRGWLKATWAVATALCALVAVDLFSADKRYLNHDSFIARRQASGPVVQMDDVDRAILADTTTHYRVLDIPGFDSPNTSYYHKAVGGYHAAKLTRYQDLIDSHLRPYMSSRGFASDSAVVDMLNARYIIDNTGRLTLNERAMGPAWLVDSVEYVVDANNEMAALSFIDVRTAAVADQHFAAELGTQHAPLSPGDTIYLTSYAPDRLTYHAHNAGNAVAVFSEVYYPEGWTLTVDGEEVPLGRVNYVLRAARLTPGSHTLEMTFRPASVAVTVTLARISIVIIFLLIALAAGIALVAPGRINGHGVTDSHLA